MATVEKITIALTAEMASSVRSAVAAGEYASTSEAIRDAVRQWQERRDLFGYRVEDLQALVQDGLESGPSPRPSMTEVKAAARRRLGAARQDCRARRRPERPRLGSSSPCIPIPARDDIAPGIRRWPRT